MTKKHFIALADVIKDNFNSFTPAAIDTLASFCKSQNTNFNKERWLDYIGGLCEPNGGKVKK